MLILLAAGGYNQDGVLELDYCEDPQRAAPSEVVGEVTWYADVEPIVLSRCATCHSDGATAPFALETYEQVVALAQPVYEAVVRHEMPPWSAEPCCGKTYTTDRSLTQEELDVLVGWLDQDTPLGDEADRREPPEAAGSLARVDARLEMAEPYAPSGQNGTNDEVRCFLVEIPEEVQGRYVTGLHFQPGNRSVVHHAIVDLVRQVDLGDFVARDKLSSGPGFDCYGGGGTGTGGNIGGWVPGQGALEFPDGLGRQIEPGSWLLLNLHYDLSAGSGTDQSALELQLEDSVQSEITALALWHPLWLYGESMAVPGDGAETSYGFSWDPSRFYGWKTYDIWGVFFHMHELGQSGTVSILREDGTHECLLHIDDWDFGWQGDYWFDEPTTLAPGEHLYIECTWLNPWDDVAWEADQEMCAGAVYVTETSSWF